MKRFSVTAISPLCKRIGSVIFMLLILCGVGFQTTEFAELHRAQAHGIAEQTCLTQASVIVSSAQLAVPRLAMTLIKNVRQTVPLCFSIYSPEESADSPANFVRTRWQSIGIAPRPGSPYGILPLPHSPPLNA